MWTKLPGVPFPGEAAGLCKVHAAMYTAFVMCMSCVPIICFYRLARFVAGFIISMYMQLHIHAYATVYRVYAISMYM